MRSLCSMLADLSHKACLPASTGAHFSPSQLFESHLMHPAGACSVMTAWATERAALEHMIENFGSGVFACVMDRSVVAFFLHFCSCSVTLTRLRPCSYDYEHALSEILPTVAAKKIAKGGFMVLRPDSGDPVQTVVLGLRAAEKVFGCDINSKGFKVPRGCSVIQGALALHSVVVVLVSPTRRDAGDGINSATLELIIDAVHEAGFSAQSVGYGMGGGLLQKVCRSTAHNWLGIHGGHS